MLKAYDTPDDEPVPPECRATLARIQSACDGATAPESLDADPHAVACSLCRARIRAAHLLLSVLAAPVDPVAVPAGFADRVLATVNADQRVQRRDRFAKRTATAAGLALAAAVLVGVWFIALRNGINKPDESVQQPTEPAPELAPGSRETIPEPHAIRFDDAVANTGQAIRDTPRPFTESVAIAPKLFDVLTGPFDLPAPPADPVGTALAPARKSLSELPVAARAGLEPVTDTAEKAFTRFLRDVGSVKPNS